MPFRNRLTAARQLAEELARFRGESPLVLAIPRGAVPMGQLIAWALDGDLDVVLVRKLGAPGNPELAIGSVTESGEVAVADYAAALGVDRDYVDREAEHQLAVLHRRREKYTPGRPAADPAGRTVIVVDDGVATGSTMIAALTALRRQGPRRLVAAMAVAPRETADKLRAYADEVVCLETPRHFYAVGQFFEDFSEVKDDEVIATLEMARREAHAET